MDRAHAFPPPQKPTEQTGRRALVLAWGAWALMMLILCGILVWNPKLNVLWRETGLALVAGPDLYGAAVPPSQGGYRYAPVVAAMLALLAVMPIAARLRTTNLRPPVPVLLCRLACLR